MVTRMSWGPERTREHAKTMCLRVQDGTPARAHAGADAAQLGGLEAMLKQQLLHGAQDIGTVLAFLRALLCFQQRRI